MITQSITRPGCRRGVYAIMTKDKVFSLQNHHQSQIEDPLTEILRKGARHLIEQAIEAELELLMERTAPLRDAEGRQRVVSSGHLPKRAV